LFFGDIVGKAGRHAVAAVLPQWRERYQPDLVVANAENLAHGMGVTRKTLEEMRTAGVDFFTSGNHIWQQKEAEEVLSDRSLPIIRPANYPVDTPGDGYRVIEAKAGKFVLIANILGQTFFRENLDSPFVAIDQILEKNKDQKLAALIVDFHKEVTSEAQAMGFYLDGRVTTMVGTHTHIPTADERVLPQGTAFITDVGMVGVRDTSLGVEVGQVIRQMQTHRPERFEHPETGLCRVDAVLIETKDNSFLAQRMQRINQEVTV
jgi:metallophosphoesterase (TIGR00282 family)